MGKKKLSVREIDKILYKIRKSYDDYIIEFIKPFNEKKAFEDRYFQALRANINLSRFFLDEIYVINKLIEREKAEKIKIEQKKYQQTQKKKKNFADVIIEENYNKIIKYPALSIHDDANEEICRLFGAIKTLVDNCWFDIDRILRKSYLLPFSGPRFELESKIYELSSSKSDSCPPRLSRYKNLLSNSRKQTSVIEKEEKRCILEIAFFLHDIIKELNKQLENDRLDENDKAALNGIIIKIREVINDFRLKDLKPDYGRKN